MSKSRLAQEIVQGINSSFQNYFRLIDRLDFRLRPSIVLCLWIVTQVRSSPRLRETIIFLSKPCIFTADNYNSIAYLNSWMASSSVLHLTDFGPPVFVVFGDDRLFATSSVTSKDKNRRISRYNAIVWYPCRKWIIFEFYPLVFFI